VTARLGSSLALFLALVSWPSVHAHSVDYTVLLAASTIHLRYGQSYADNNVEVIPVNSTTIKPPKTH